MQLTIDVCIAEPEAEKLRGIRIDEERHKIHVDVRRIAQAIAEKKFPGKAVVIHEISAHDGTPCDHHGVGEPSTDG